MHVHGIIKHAKRVGVRYNITSRTDLQFTVFSDVIPIQFTYYPLNKIHTRLSKNYISTLYIYSTHTQLPRLLAMASSDSSGIIHKDEWDIFEYKEDGNEQQHTRSLRSEQQIQMMFECLHSTQKTSDEVRYFYQEREQRFICLVRLLQQEKEDREKAYVELQNELLSANTKNTVLNLALQRKNADISSLRNVYKAGRENARQELSNVYEYVAHIERELRAAQSYTSPPPLYKQ